MQYTILPHYLSVLAPAPLYGLLERRQHGAPHRRASRFLNSTCRHPTAMWQLLADMFYMSGMNSPRGAVYQIDRQQVFQRYTVHGKVLHTGEHYHLPCRRAFPICQPNEFTSAVYYQSILS